MPIDDDCLPVNQCQYIAFRAYLNATSASYTCIQCYLWVLRLRSFGEKRPTIRRSPRFLDSTLMCAPMPEEEKAQNDSGN
jgi:hypothetical protein